MVNTVHTDQRKDTINEGSGQSSFFLLTLWLESHLPAIKSINQSDSWDLETEYDSQRLCNVMICLSMSRLWCIISCRYSETRPTCTELDCKGTIHWFTITDGRLSVYQSSSTPSVHLKKGLPLWLCDVYSETLWVKMTLAWKGRLKYHFTTARMCPANSCVQNQTTGENLENDWD